jgi:hypothetical protein
MHNGTRATVAVTGADGQVGRAPLLTGLVLAMALAIGIASPAAGASPAPTVGAPELPGAARSVPRTGAEAAAVPDRPAVAEFFDALIPAQLERRRIPAAVVAVVQDGELAFARGLRLG